MLQLTTFKFLTLQMEQGNLPSYDDPTFDEDCDITVVPDDLSDDDTMVLVAKVKKIGRAVQVRWDTQSPS